MARVGVGVGGVAGVAGMRPGTRARLITLGISSRFSIAFGFSLSCILARIWALMTSIFSLRSSSLDRAAGSPRVEDETTCDRSSEIEAEDPVMAEEEAAALGMLREPLDGDLDEEASEDVALEAPLECRAATALARQFGQIPRLSRVSVRFRSILFSDAADRLLGPRNVGASEAAAAFKDLSVRCKFLRRATSGDWREKGAARLEATKSNVAVAAANVRASILRNT